MRKKGKPAGGKQSRDKGLAMVIGVAFQRENGFFRESSRSFAGKRKKGMKKQNEKTNQLSTIGK